MRARYLDPQTGRFTQRDPLGSLQGPNLYDYAGGDPLTRVDPSGTIWGAQLFWASTKFMGTFGPLSDGALRVLIYSGHAADKFRQFEVIWRPFHQAWRAEASLGNAATQFGKYVLNGVRAAPQVVSSVARTAVTGIGNVISSIEITGVPAVAGILTADVAALSGGTILRRGPSRLPPVSLSAPRLGMSPFSGACGHLGAVAVALYQLVTGGWLFGIPPTAELGTPIVSSHDPNDLIGPAVMAPRTGSHPTRRCRTRSASKTTNRPPRRRRRCASPNSSIPPSTTPLRTRQL